MTIPNMKTQRIKRLERGAFTIQSKADAKRPAHTICNHCGDIGDCKIRQGFERIGVTADVHACKSFIPVLGFSILDGLDDPEWNTMRLGKAWSTRLPAGQIVRLLNTKENKFLGDATVLRSECVSLKYAVTHHSKANHALSTRIRAQKINPSDAETEMRRILRNAYGSSYTKDDRPVSVIYLERL